MIKLKIMLLSTIFLSPGVFAMEGQLTDFVGVSSAENSHQSLRQSEKIFGNCFDLVKAQTLFEESQLKTLLNLEEIVDFFSKLWRVHGNLMAFAYLKHPLLFGHLTPEIQGEVEPFTPTVWAQEQVDISVLMTQKTSFMNETQNNYLKKELKKFMSAQSSGRAFYEYGSLETTKSSPTKGLVNFQKAALRGEVRAFMALEKLKNSNSVRFDAVSADFINESLTLKKEYVEGSPGEYEHMVASTLYGLQNAFLFGKVMPSKESFEYWTIQAAHMGHKVGTRNYLGLAAQSEIINEADVLRLQMLRHLVSAKNGSIASQNILARAFEKGQNGLKINLERAYYWYQECANNEKAGKGEYANMGIVYTRGIGVGKSSLEATKWFEKAAYFGDERSIVDLAREMQEKLIDFAKVKTLQPTAPSLMSPLTATNSSQDIHHVAYPKHLTSATLPPSEQSELSSAKLLLAFCYEKGLGLGQNYEKAFHYYKSCLEDKGTSTIIIGESYNQLGLFHMNKLNSKPDDRLANAFFDKAIASGSLTACYNKGRMYHLGRGEEDNIQNYEKASKFFLRAAEAGDPDAQYELGMYYTQEIPFAKNFQTAHHYLALAESQGHLTARHNRIVLFMEGMGSADQTQENVKAALIQNAELGHLVSQLVLAGACLAREGVLKLGYDPKKAREWLKKVLDQDLSNQKEIRAIAQLLFLLSHVAISDSNEVNALIEEVKQVEIEQIEIKQVEIESPEISKLKTSSASSVGQSSNAVLSVKRSHRDLKSERDVASAAKKRQDFIENLHSNNTLLDSENEELAVTQMHTCFSEKEMGILEAFARKEGVIKPRELDPIFKILQKYGMDYKKTKSGFSMIDQTQGTVIGGHRDHGSKKGNIVDPAKAANMQKLLGTVLGKSI